MNSCTVTNNNNSVTALAIYPAISLGKIEIYPPPDIKNNVMMR
jgi:hypothetical protein